jgi:hypothetical protein
MRHMRPSVLSAAVLALCALAGAASPATAAEQVPFTITEQLSSTAADTFTATGPLCPSGTFVDAVESVGGAQSSQPKIELLIRTVYTCDDGSGTFDVLKHVFLAINPDGSATNTGPIQILGGIGAYAGLVGHGEDNGSNTGSAGVGRITGWVLQDG